MVYFINKTIKQNILLLSILLIFSNMLSSQPLYQKLKEFYNFRYSTPLVRCTYEINHKLKTNIEHRENIAYFFSDSSLLVKSKFKRKTEYNYFIKDSVFIFNSDFQLEKMYTDFSEGLVRERIAPMLLWPSNAVKNFEKSDFRVVKMDNSKYLRLLCCDFFNQDKKGRFRALRERNETTWYIFDKIECKKADSILEPDLRHLLHLINSKSFDTAINIKPSNVSDFKISNCKNKDTLQFSFPLSKPIVISFSHMRCRPCRYGYPLLDSMVREFGDSSVVLIDPTYDSAYDHNMLKRLIIEKNYSFIYSKLVSPEQNDFFKFSIYPTYIVVGRDGSILLETSPKEDGTHKTEIYNAYLRALNE